MFSADREKTFFSFCSNPNSNAVAFGLIVYDIGETSAYKVYQEVHTICIYI
jgi:hypothetical protein